MFKIDSVYKQGKNYHPQTYVEECKYIDVEKEQRNMLSHNDGFFEVHKEGLKDFCNLSRVTKTINKLTRRLCSDLQKS